MKNKMPEILPPGNLPEILMWRGSTPEDRKTAILQNYLRGTESYLIVGCLLTMARKERDWQKDGSEASNWWQWVENELKIKRSNAHRMMQVWHMISPLLEKHRDLILRIDFSKLVAIMPVLDSIKDDEPKLLAWLDRAEVNTVQDLENNIREFFNNGKLKPTDTCAHTSTQPFVKCRDCGKIFRDPMGERTDLLEALLVAKETIRLWHGPEAWDIYEEKSPEMAQINAAIARYQKQE